MTRINRTNLQSRLTAALVVCLGAVALIPAGASASSTWFGSSLNHSPANAGSSCAEDGVLGTATCTHVGSFYPGFSGRAKAPANGTVTAFRIRAEGPTTMTFRLVKVRNVSSNHRTGQAKVVVKGQTVQVKGPTTDQMENGIYPVETFKANLKVRKGYEIAINTKHNTAEYCSDGTPGQMLFDPVLKLGQGFRTNNGIDDCLMLVQAVIKK
jgi:hypothetical protein